MAKRPRRNWRAVGMAMPDVARWYKFRSSRSRNSADINLRNLLLTLERYDGKKPADLLALDDDALDDYMQDLVDFLLTKVEGSTAKKYVEAIKSYLGWHRRKLGRPLSIPGGSDSPKAEAQTIPDQAKLGKLLAACDQRTSVIAALEAFAGVRPQVIGKYDRSDGLRLGDFPELELEPEIRFTVTPAVIRVRKEISKTRKAYTTFLGPQGCDYLVEYLQARRRRKEKLTKQSAAVTHEERKRLNGEFLCRTNIQEALRLRMRAVGINDSSYILRSYFDNRILLAESHGVPALYREFWMGHKGGMQMKYALRKEQLPPDMTEDMRRCYAKALPYLETTRPMTTEDPVVPIMGILLQQLGGYTADQVERLELRGKSQAELLALLPPPAAKPQDPPTRAQKVVGGLELEQALLTGWLYKASLPDGRAIVERAG